MMTESAGVWNLPVLAAALTLAAVMAVTLLASGGGPAAAVVGSSRRLSAGSGIERNTGRGRLLEGVRDLCVRTAY